MKKKKESEKIENVLAANNIVFGELVAHEVYWESEMENKKVPKKKIPMKRIAGFAILFIMLTIFLLPVSLEYGVIGVVSFPIAVSVTFAILYIAAGWALEEK